MVAVLVSLRLRVLWNSLRRSTWQLVGASIGALYGLGLVVGLIAALIALSFAPQELARTVLVTGGSVLILGWLLGPLLIAGVDQTLEPAKLAPFPIPRQQLFIALTASGVLGIPGVVTSIAVLASAIVWWRHPLAILASLVCTVIAVLTCVVASRSITTLSAGLASGRRFRELTGIIVIVPLVLAGPIIIGVTAGLTEFSELLPRVADGLAWSPLGAVWAVPADVANGAWLMALARFAIALATLGILGWLWHSALNRALDAPIRTTSRARTQNGIGFFGIVPGTRLGAVTARALSYWVRDPRYARQLITIPLIVVLLIFYSTLDGGASWLPNVAAPIIAFTFALSVYSDVSFDGTAFALHVSSGVPGWADRGGRALAVVSFAVPVVIVVAIATTLISGTVADLPALLGLSLGLVLTGLGAASVTSALLVFPVPAPGDSPFKSQPGAALPSTLASFGTWGAMTVLALPEIVLSIVFFITRAPLFGWLALTVGVLLGAACLVGGIALGGKVLDKRGPELLAQVRK